mgnify:CR=1 FL=1
MDNQQLITLALKARENAYAPYSHFTVGAAVLTKDGLVYTGCNIENASYGATNCAERTAIFKAVSEGKKEFVKIAIVGGKEGEEIMDFAYPCGVCRQVIAEFCNPVEMLVVVAKSETEYIEKTLDELLPLSFGGSVWNI